MSSSISLQLCFCARVFTEIELTDWLDLPVSLTAPPFSAVPALGLQVWGAHLFAVFSVGASTHTQVSMLT